MDIETNYKTVVNNGEVLHKAGWHDETSMCDCNFDSKHGNYRDVEVVYDGYHYVFYHSTPIVVESEGGLYRLSRGGWKTKTTKDRINEHIPSQYQLVQRDYVWYVETDESTTDFHSGMVIVS